MLLPIYWYIFTMSRVSKKPLHKKMQAELEEQLLVIISSLNNKQQTNAFLDEFLTKEEKLMLGKRLILYILLYKGWTSTDIHTILSMSYETIRWYKQIYENKPEVFKEMINRLSMKEEGSNLLKKLEKFLEPIGLALSAKTSMKARAKLMNGDFWNE